MRCSPCSLRAFFRLRIALLLGFLVFFSVAARAQTGVYATIDASDFQTPNVGWQYGPTFGLYHDIVHAPFVRLGFDARATLLGSGSTKAYMGLVGPHVQIHPHVIPVKPYGEVLIGAGHVNVGQGFAKTDETAFAYEGVIGADWTIFPHIDWRVIEYSFGGFSGSNVGDVSPRTLSTGLVLRLP